MISSNENEKKEIKENKNEKEDPYPFPNEQILKRFLKCLRGSIKNNECCTFESKRGKIFQIGKKRLSAKFCLMYWTFGYSDTKIIANLYCSKKKECINPNHIKKDNQEKFLKMKRHDYQWNLEFKMKELVKIEDGLVLIEIEKQKELELEKKQKKQELDSLTNVFILQKKRKRHEFEDAGDTSSVSQEEEEEEEDELILLKEKDQIFDDPELNHLLILKANSIQNSFKKEQKFFCLEDFTFQIK